MYLDDWQRMVLDIALAETDEGKWAAFEVAVVVPRQNGKGSILEAVELAALFLFDEELILHSAHEFKTAKEAFYRLRSLLTGAPDLNEQVKQIKQSNEEVSIELRNGKRLRYVARKGGSGRGFSADRIILDEAMVLGPDTMAALLPTLSSRANPQIWYTSSAPGPMSDQLHAVRKRALGDRPGRLAYLEWSAAETFDAVDLDDREAWRLANPSMSGARGRPTEEFIAAERDAMPAEEFARERLGVPDRPADEIGDTALSQAWREHSMPAAVLGDPVCLSFDVTPEHDRASIVACGPAGDGAAVELIANEPGTGWVVDRLAGIIARHAPAAVVADMNGPAGALSADLAKAGIEVQAVSPKEHGQACGLLQDSLDQGLLVHRNEPQLNAAIVGAGRRQAGDTWTWSRRSSAVDISPLVAATLAHWAHRQNREPAAVAVVNLADFLEDE